MTHDEIKEYVKENESIISDAIADLKVERETYLLTLKLIRIRFPGSQAAILAEQAINNHPDLLEEIYGCDSEVDHE